MHVKMVAIVVQALHGTRLAITPSAAPLYTGLSKRLGSMVEGLEFRVTACG